MIELLNGLAQFFGYMFITLIAFGMIAGVLFVITRLFSNSSEGKTIWQFWMSSRHCFQIKIAADLWYDKTNRGKLMNLFRVGYSEITDCPNTRLYSLIVLFLSVQFFAYKDVD